MGKHMGDSIGNPLRVDWLETADLSVTGRIGRSFLPGKNHLGVSGLLHARSAALDCERLRQVYGTNTLVLLNEDREIARFVNDVPPPAGPQDLVTELARQEIELLRLPIPDGGTPSAEQLPEVRRLLAAVVERLRTGSTVAVACRGGLGRTGTILALTLRELGCSADDSVRRVRRMNAACIEREGQEAFVRSWVPASGL